MENWVGDFWQGAIVSSILSTILCYGFWLRTGSCPPLDADQMDVSHGKLYTGYQWKGNGISYIGSYHAQHGMHGYGEWTYPNGLVFKGMLREGQRHGVGMLEFDNGDRWVGEWYHDQQYKGFYQKKDGSVHLQQWHAGPNGIYRCTRAFQAITPRPAKNVSEA